MALTQFDANGGTLSDAHFVAIKTPEQLQQDSHPEDEESSMNLPVHSSQLTSEKRRREGVDEPSGEIWQQGMA